MTSFQSITESFYGQFGERLQTRFFAGIALRMRVIWVVIWGLVFKRWGQVHISVRSWRSRPRKVDLPHRIRKSTQPAIASDVGVDENEQEATRRGARNLFRTQYRHVFSAFLHVRQKLLYARVERE